MARVPPLLRSSPVLDLQSFQNPPPGALSDPHAHQAVCDNCLAGAFRAAVRFGDADSSKSDDVFTFTSGHVFNLLMQFSLQHMDAILRRHVAGTEAAAMFGACPGTGDKKCLAVGEVSGECKAADKLSDDKDSAGAKARVGTLAMGLAAAAMAVLR